MVWNTLRKGVNACKSALGCGPRTRKNHHKENGSGKTHGMETRGNKKGKNAAWKQVMANADRMVDLSGPYPVYVNTGERVKEGGGRTRKATRKNRKASRKNRK